MTGLGKDNGPVGREEIGMASSGFAHTRESLPHAVYLHTITCTSEAALSPLWSGGWARGAEELRGETSNLEITSTTGLTSGGPASDLCKEAYECSIGTKASHTPLTLKLSMSTTTHSWYGSEDAALLLAQIGVLVFFDNPPYT